MSNVSGASVRRSICHKAGVALASMGAIVLLYVGDDVLWAIPIAFVVNLSNGWVAFVLFAFLYTVGSYVIAVAGVRAYDRRQLGQPSPLASRLARFGTSRQGRWTRYWLGFGQASGFVWSSVLMGGIATTWLMRYGGYHRDIRRVAWLSSAIFGVSFAGMYAGIFGFLW